MVKEIGKMKRLGGWDGEGGREGDERGRRYGNVCKIGRASCRERV